MGVWEDDKRRGRGILKLTDGRQFPGEWKDGTFKRDEAVTPNDFTPRAVAIQHGSPKATTVENTVNKDVAELPEELVSFLKTNKDAARCKARTIDHFAKKGGSLKQSDF